VLVAPASTRLVQSQLRHTGGVVVRVGIVEDDALLRSTLTESLSARQDFEVVATGATGAEIILQAQKKTVDVALLDVHLGAGPSGFDLAATLRSHLPLLGIVFLSSVKDPRLLGYQPAALPQGARYVLKSELSDFEVLVNVLRSAHEDSLDKQSSPVPKLPFTQSQIEILRLVAAGHSNAAIATERVVTERAVEMAVSRLAKHLGLREKPGANQRVHIAMTFFREMGWTP